VRRFNNTTLLTAAIVIYGGGDTAQTNQTYKFIKSVEQLPNYKGKVLFANDVRVLTFSTTIQLLFYHTLKVIQMNLFYGLNQGNTFILKYNNSYQSPTFTSNNLKRIFFSDYGVNEVSTDFKTNNHNKLKEVWVNNTLNSIINIKKELNQKWFILENGSIQMVVTYWLFEKILNDT
jgi:hypothetical protein